MVVLRRPVQDARRRQSPSRHGSRRPWLFHHAPPQAGDNPPVFLVPPPRYGGESSSSPSSRRAPRGEQQRRQQQQRRRRGVAEAPGGGGGGEGRLRPAPRAEAVPGDLHLRPARLGAVQVLAGDGSHRKSLVPSFPRHPRGRRARRRRRHLRRPGPPHQGSQVPFGSAVPVLQDDDLESPSRPPPLGVLDVVVLLLREQQREQQRQGEEQRLLIS
mmetsp:Transcript_33473/g.106892  ORF Transcript_33473/g.106892 Transcript_33473/m.106892 type:complete len:215 (-) Transcript_33473:1024-1668(-)